jgi:putative transcriptional regulator
MFNKVKEQRIINSLSQGNLAEKLGVSRPTISNLERGVYEPSGSLMLSIAKVFGKPVEQIFYLDDVKLE